MKAVNLLPPDMRSAGRSKVSGPEPAGGSGPFVVLGALALCVLAMTAYVLAGNVIEKREAELARVTVEHQAVQTQAAALRPYGDFQDMAVRRVETVSSLASLRFDWEQGLRDVSRALPGDVTLSALEGSISVEGGGGGSALRGAIASPAITLKGCTSNQSAVARMMSRLRAVRGVTRVSLAKSAKTKVATAGTGAQEAGRCGKGSRPEFEVIVFFERSGAATAPSTATTAASTAAAPVAAGGSEQASAPAADAGQPANASPTTPASSTP